MGLGRKRGRPAGSKNKATLDKEAAREVLREMVKEKLRPMTDAQIANAQGIKYLVARNKRTGEFKKLSEAEAILKMGQESDNEIIEVWEERPNVQAFTDLMNRTLDKPTETVHQTITGDADLLSRLDAWKQRNAKGKK